MNKALKDAILNGLYDSHFPGHELYGPRLLENDKNDNIWLTLRRELLTCQSFTWAVAFITQDMLVPLKVVLADLAKKHVTGTLITGDYLGFNEPNVFAELTKIPNLKVKIADQTNFHVKGYLFKHENYETVVIGSANFTRAALLANCEWALKVSSTENAALTKQICRQLQKLDQKSAPLTSTWIMNYQRQWKRPNFQKITAKNITQEISPNKMQKQALQNLNELVAAGQKRGLVVSATGTGKTYLGAFAVKDFAPKKFLYIVHRRQIAQKSLSSFRKVIAGKKADYGLLSGNVHESNCKYVFATVQTLTQKNVLNQFDPAEFDYILIDEAHRSASPSYQRILHYFKPKFWLGMTATPERMDKQNVYQIFDYNLAYEIRLQDALEEKMLTPFHYVGVQDYEQDGQVIDETTNLRYLIADERVKYILKQMNYYGYCGAKACGLIFCSRQIEAKKLAVKFIQKGHPAVALTNEDSEADRQKTVKQLKEGSLEYIVTVDLFNEGVDIPELNQIIMLRNTQSSIVFIQQLGRGLRKYPGKEFVTVLDFIGNYRNNYLIPIALNGDTSRSRDLARRETKLPTFVGLSTINFSQIAAARILQSLDKVKLDGLRELRQAYTELKQKIGRPPLLLDFAHYGSVSPLVFAENRSLKHYGNFLQKMGEKLVLTKYESQVLAFITKELVNGKRPHELLLLKLLLTKTSISNEEYCTELDRNGAYHTSELLHSVDDILTLSFFDVKSGKSTKKAEYGNYPLIEHDLLNYRLSLKLTDALQDKDFRMLFLDAIKTGLLLSKKYRSDKQFTLYKQYDREDVCRLLNWPQDVSAPMYGYRVENKETPIFITYKKDSDKKRNAIYNNSLADGCSLRWYTRSPRHIASPEVQKLLHNSQMKIHLFVKQNDATGKEFFYLGQAKIQKDTVKEEKIGPKKKAAVGMNLLLSTPLSASMYDLLFTE